MEINKVNAEPYVSLTGTNSNYISKLEIKTENSASSLKSDSLNIKIQNKNEVFGSDNKKTPVAKAIPFNNISPLPEESKTGKPDIRFFFFSDSHSNESTLNKFINDVNSQNPELVIDGGDMVVDGTEPELDKAYAERENFKVPLYMATGNHDVDFRGVFTKPPKVIPPIQSFDAKGVHFILLDNESQKISDDLFNKLESDLKANEGKATIVAMHVPPMISKEPLTMKIGKHISGTFVSPVMKDPKEVERFTSLMSKYHVKAVFSGHTHSPDESVKDGVKYITSAATGGLSPGFNIQNEYLDISLKDNDVEIKRVQLREGDKNPASFVSNTMNFYKDVNTFNHENLGWNYIPSASIQYEVGAKVFETDRGTSVASNVAVTMEKVMGKKGGMEGTLSLGIGPQDLNTQFSVGYKYRVIGDYNKGAFVAGTAGVNGGIVTGKLSGGVGAGISTGIDYNNFTLSVGHEWATNYQATTASVGYRF